MFDLDDPEVLKSELERAHAQARQTENRLVDKILDLAGAIADACAELPAPPRYDLEGTQSEYYAKGAEAEWYASLKAQRDHYVKLHALLTAALKRNNIDPAVVSTKARQATKEKLDQASRLRVQADQLEAEARAIKEQP